MKITKKFFAILTVLAMLLAIGCSGDESTAPGGGDFDDLVGDWDVTEYSYTAVSNPALTFDLLASLGASISMSIQSNGNYTITTTIQGITNSSSGQFATNAGGDGFQTGDPDLNMTFTSNQIIWTVQNQEWDFGNGQEAATLRQVWTRR